MPNDQLETVGLTQYETRRDSTGSVAEVVAESQETQFIFATTVTRLVFITKRFQTFLGPNIYLIRLSSTEK